MPYDFIRKLDDVLPPELSLLGHGYATIVSEIVETRGGNGAIVRLPPPYDDFELDEGVRRRLFVAIEVPGRATGPEE